MARPSKLTPDVQADIVAAIRAGNYMETAASFAGINKDTLFAWLKRGKRDKSGPYRDFSDAVSRALAEAETSALASIEQAASGGTVVAKTTVITETVTKSGTTTHKTVTTETYQPPQWQAAAWRLERRFPDRWALAKRGEEDSAIQQATPLLGEFLKVIREGGKDVTPPKTDTGHATAPCVSNDGEGNQVNP